MKPNRRTPPSLRTALIGIAASALVVVGAAACSDEDDDATEGTTVPTESVVVTEAPPSTNPVDTSEPAPPATETSEPSTPVEEPSTTVADPQVVGAPTVVYATTGDPIDPDDVQTLFDPADGSIVDTQPVDVEASQAAQAALPGGVVSTVDLGDVSYAFDQVVFDSGTLDPDVYPDVDLCGQNIVTVESPAGSALPERAHVLSVSPDGRYVVTLSSECPEEGTMGSDGVGTQLPFDATFQLFDAMHPELPGTTLLAGVPALNVGLATFSANSRFVALETFAEEHRYDVFDLESGEQLDVAGGCIPNGTNHSRFIGPWIGESSIALMLDCDDEQRLVVRDLMPDGEELVVVVAPNDSGYASRAEVDYAHFSSPATTWFLLCEFSQQACEVGQGDGQRVVLSGVTDASFLPLGFVPGN